MWYESLVYCTCAQFDSPPHLILTLNWREMFGDCNLKAGVSKISLYVLFEVRSSYTALFCLAPSRTPCPPRAVNWFNSSRNIRNEKVVLPVQLNFSSPYIYPKIPPPKLSTQKDFKIICLMFSKKFIFYFSNKYSTMS